MWYTLLHDAIASTGRVYYRSCTRKIKHLICLRVFVCASNVSARLVLAGFRGWASAHMGHRRGKGDAIAQAPHEAGVQPLVPPERADAPHSILRRVGSTLGALAV